MINQQTVINLAIEAGVIDSADINSIHISQEYIDDLTRFAALVIEQERDMNNVKYFNRVSATAMQDIRDIIKDAVKAKGES